MIYVLSDNKKCYIEEYIKNNNTLFSIKIYSRYKNYIDKDIYDIWVQVINDSATALISKSDGYMIVDVLQSADLEEIFEFVNIIGYSEILCDYNIDIFDNSKINIGYVMKYSYNNKIDNYIIKTNDITFNLNEYKEAYEVLNSCKDDNFKIPSYEDFILDMSYKVRKNVAEVLTIKFKNTPIATASMIYSCSYGAVIGAVAVKKEYQNLGYGKIIVSKLIQNILDKQIKNIYLQCNTERNKKFYNKLNFIECEKFKNITYKENR